jgi:AcrR family transcriptional regulator
MARPRTVPDAVVHDAVLALMRTDGVKSVTFGAVAARSGLAASSLVQRHRSVEGLLRDARAGGWERLSSLADEAASTAPTGTKGAVALLKALGPPLAEQDPDLSDPAVAAAAAGFRTRVEAALALRLGGGGRARDAAAVLFAAWAGQVLWHAAGGRGFRLKEALRLLLD